MNNTIKILDCTLREAPIEGSMWGGLSLGRTICNLEESGVDVIECGILKNEEYVAGSSVFSDITQINELLRHKKAGTAYAVLIDHGRYDISKIPNATESRIDMVRVCFKKNEIKEAISTIETIKSKGYLVSVQHVDIIDYSEKEINDFIDVINSIEPFCYSIVDTFGAMYEDDLVKLCELIDRKLDNGIRLGFHAHNNLMLANANTERFISFFYGKRNIVVDSSLFGCGRGAGNANTELIAEFLNKKFSKKYDIDVLLDNIDSVINAAQKKAEWGYSIPYFLSGTMDAHSFNAKYLFRQHNIRSVDLRNILLKLDDSQKKLYDYGLIDKLYYEYFNGKVDDSVATENINKIIGNRELLIIAPGKSLINEKERIIDFIKTKNPFIIDVNNDISIFRRDAIFYSSNVRYSMNKYTKEYMDESLLIIKTSNIRETLFENEIVISYGLLVKKGWVYMDSSAILLLRLLSRLGVNEINIAGFDGYGHRGNAFYEIQLDTALSNDERVQATIENQEMILDLLEENPKMKLNFITKSIYHV